MSDEIKLPPGIDPESAQAARWEEMQMRRKGIYWEQFNAKAHRATKESYTEQAAHSRCTKRTTPQLLEYALGRMQSVRNSRSWLGIGWCHMVKRLTLLSQLERGSFSPKTGLDQFIKFQPTQYT